MSTAGGLPWGNVSIPAFLWMFLHLIAMVGLFFIAKGSAALMLEDDINNPEAGTTALTWILTAVMIGVVYKLLGFHARPIWVQIVGTLALMVPAGLLLEKAGHKADDEI